MTGTIASQKKKRRSTSTQLGIVKMMLSSFVTMNTVCLINEKKVFMSRLKVWVKLGADFFCCSTLSLTRI